MCIAIRTSKPKYRAQSAVIVAILLSHKGRDIAFPSSEKPHQPGMSAMGVSGARIKGIH